MPRGDPSGRMGGFQLWANLPATQKMIDPRYRGITADEIPVERAPGIEVRVICGSVGTSVGPVREVVIEPEYLDVTLAAGTAWAHDTQPGHTVFAYLFDGAARFGTTGSLLDAGRGTVVLFADGERVSATAGESGGRFLLVGGRPLREPIAWRGPIVMNTIEELDTAWRELQKGTFVKHRSG
jgi:redox-sensitive bicupin YhaK (pirin superfamily)